MGVLRHARSGRANDCGRLALLSDDPTALRSTEHPAPGIGVSNFRCKDFRPTLGTIGFHAIVNGSRSGQLLVVSNRHVFFAADGAQGDPVYLCRTGQEEAGIRDLEPIAHLHDEGGEENHRYAYPGEDTAEYFVDCATARVRSPEMACSSSRLVRRVARVHPLDVVGSRRYRVRKAGIATGLTAGEVFDAAATVRSDGVLRVRNLAIRGRGARFAEPGDSGALIVSDRDEAVGMLWGRDDDDPDIAYGCHIHPVLDRLGVSMLTQGMPCGIETLGGSI